MAYDDEEELLRAVSLRNAQSILLARQRAEEELLKAKEALELKTEELGQSLALVRATLESTTNGILVVDEGGKVTAFNENFVRMWRMPREIVDSGEHRQLLEVMGHQFTDPGQFFAKIDEISASSHAENIDLLQLADGRVIERFSRILLVNDRKVGRVWNFRDITELNRMQESERRLVSIVESSNDAIISKTLDGTIWSWNAAAERLFGYTAAQAVGRHISFLIPADRAGEEDQIIARLRAGERVEHFDTVRTRSDGQPVHVSLTISPLNDAAGRIVGASKIARDITERKRMEDEMRQYITALSDADRHKNEFLATLAHELRNPLVPIRNALQIIRLTGNEGAEVRGARMMMERQVGQMVRLIDDLLDVSRINRGKLELRKERVELASVIRSAVDTAHPLIEAAGHELTLSVTPQIYLDADPVRLAQVFTNLLNNAAKYTEPGGHIWLTTTHGEKEVVITVRDTGIGIPTDALPAIFDMFMQVDRSLEKSQGGLGIGLTLAKRIVEMHGGKVEARSEGEGKGAEFIAHLPVVSVPLARQPKSDDDEQRAPPAVCRVLVADDNRDAAESMSMVLRLMGNDVRTVHDGVQAVEEASAFRPDVILLDIGMPRMNGYDAARRIREQRWGKNMVLVALTGWGQEEDKRLASEAGFDQHFTKPVNPADLEQLISGLHTDSAPRDPLLQGK